MILIFLGRDILAENVRIVASARAIPQNTVLERLLVLVEQTERSTLAGKSYGDICLVWKICLRGSLPRCEADTVPHLFEALLAPAGMRRFRRVFLIPMTKRIALFIKNHHRASGRSRIDAYECLFIGRHESLP